MSDWVLTIARVNWLAGQLASFPNTERALNATQILADHLDRELKRHIDESIAVLMTPMPARPARPARPRRAATTAPSPSTRPPTIGALLFPPSEAGQFDLPSLFELPDAESE